MNKVNPKNILAIKCPSLCGEWNYKRNKGLTPDDVGVWSHVSYWWICKKGHAWHSTISSRRSGSKCPTCSRFTKKVSEHNCLSFVNPKIAADWHLVKNGDLTPLDFAPNSQQKVWWQCHNCGHEWRAVIVNRNRGYATCLRCKSVAVKTPILAKEWNFPKNKNSGLTPHNVTCGSSKKVWWKCSVCNNEWETEVKDRRANDCPKCSQIKKEWRTNKKNSLAHKYPKLIQEWHPTKNGNLTPYMIGPGSGRNVHWVCIKGHEWETPPNKRTKGGCGCPYCSNCRVGKDNCLAIVNPQLAKEWHPTKNGNTTPYNVISGSTKKVWWKCSRCGREWQALIYNRSKGRGCECYHNVVLKDGTICDSMVEAHFYLKFRKDKVNFFYRGLYGGKFGRRRYDFYFPESDTYTEVTSFFEGYTYYKKYLKTINAKRRYVKRVLHGNFRFVQYRPTKEEYNYVRQNTKKLSKDLII